LMQIVLVNISGEGRVVSGDFRFFTVSLDNRTYAQIIVDDKYYSPIDDHDKRRYQLIKYELTSTGLRWWWMDNQVVLKAIRNHELKGVGYGVGDIRQGIIMDTSDSLKSFVKMKDQVLFPDKLKTDLIKK